MIWIQAVSIWSWLAAAGVAPAPGEETREGTVLPVGCRSSRETKSAAEAHTTKCALELECVVTGYGLLVDGKFFEFDDEGNQTALKYFRETKKSEDHLVSVTGDFSGAEVRVKSLEPVSR
jgi:hypothetical protein